MADPRSPDHVETWVTSTTALLSHYRPAPDAALMKRRGCPAADAN